MQIMNSCLCLNNDQKLNKYKASIVPYDDAYHVVKLCYRSSL